MPEATNAIHRPFQQSKLSNNSLSDTARLTLPPELWHSICHFLELAKEEEIIESGFFWTPSHKALYNLGQTCRSLYQAYLSVCTGVIFNYLTGAGHLRMEGRRGDGTVTRTAILGGLTSFVTPIMERLQPMAGPRQIILAGYNFEEQNALEWVTATPTVRKLKLRTCNITYGELWIPSYITTNELYSIVDLRKSNIEALNLENRYDDGMQLSPTLALLALIPTLKALTATARAFRSIGQLPTTLDLPPLRSLVIDSHLTGSINQAHILSFLRRCPTLESLRISPTIFSRVLGPEEIPTDMPNLKEYEGRPEYLTLMRAPALRLVSVKSLVWDGGTLARSLTSMPSALESVVLELTARIDGPATDSIKRWVEEASSRWCPQLESAARFSLVLRMAPLGEWVYSAKVGRTDSGEVFIEYYSRREESLAYLTAPVNRKEPLP
ncbi:hypothetical protein FRC00_005706 [Tulasnella sp. 408]|nr:hypothetical protein FRC00_005706 [Tulasnella sp. 408]